ncbi:MAG: hypothetical protein P8I26_07025 [Flavobacteriaceae bacterium]|nr:hypothetical protein [Flavobacteriaceae bacterium]
MNTKTYNYYASFPSTKFDIDKENPFLIIVDNEMETLGWKSKIINFKFIPLFLNRNKINFLWFHWPESIWRSNRLFMKLIKAYVFILKLHFAKLMGYQIIWSSHNVMPHTLENSNFEYFMRKFLVNNVSLVVGHSRNTENSLNKKKLIPFKYTLCLHGTYDNLYEKDNKNITRKFLGFNKNDKIILIKSGRTKKNFDAACNFFSSIKNEKFNNIKFIIIGNEIETKHADYFVSGWLTNSDLGAYHKISDYVCLPYTNITCSGAYFLSLTFNKPVIAPNSDFFNMHTHNDTSVLYDSSNELRKKLKLIDADKIKINYGLISNLKNEFKWSDSLNILVGVLNKF